MRYAAIGEVFRRLTRFVAHHLRLVLRNLLRHKVRTGMTLAAIAFGVAGLILSGGFVHGIFHQLAEALIHSQSGHIQIARAGYFAQGTRSPDKFLISEPDTLKARIVRRAEVLDVMARIGFSGLLSNGRIDYPIVGEGIEPKKEAALGTFIFMIEGRNLAETDHSGALLGEGLAKTLKVHPGDVVTLLVATTEGATNLLDFEVTGVFQTFSKDYDARIIKIPLLAAQELLSTRGANTLVVSLRETGHTSRVVKSLKREFAQDRLELKDWEQLNDFYEKTVDLYDRLFGVLRLIVLLMVLLSVLNAVSVNVLERVGEFGTMRALGNRNRDVFKFVVLEGVVLGLIGALIGTLLGIALAWAISAAGIPMPPPPNSNVGYTAEIRMESSVILGAFLVGVLATVLASLFPAYRVSRIPIVEALRRIV